MVVTSEPGIGSGDREAEFLDGLSYTFCDENQRDVRNADAAYHQADRRQRGDGAGQSSRGAGRQPRIRIRIRLRDLCLG